MNNVMTSLPVPYALGIHTTTPQLGLCCSRPERGLTTHTWDLGREMSTQLHEHLFSFLHPNDLRQLEFIAVAIGPGGFTSTRLGVVTARTLAQQLQLPLFGISSLAAYVWHTGKMSVSQQHDSSLGRRPDGDIPRSLSNRTAVHMPARRGQVFGAVYDMTWKAQSEMEASATPVQWVESDQQFTPDQLVPHRADEVIDAEDWKRYLATQGAETCLELAMNEVLGYTVPSVIELATLDYLSHKAAHWSTVYPFYGQSPV